MVSTIPQDQIDDLFGAPPDPAALPMYYRSGEIITWDANTLENTVSVGGQTLVDLPVLGVAEAASYEPGVAVGIAVVGKTWAIIGRFVQPNTADATSAISVLSNRTQADTVSDTENIPNGGATYADIPDSPGPEVIINVGPSGRVLITLSAEVILYSEAVGGDGSSTASMTYAMSGANTFDPGAPFNPESVYVADTIGENGASEPNHAIDAQYSWSAVLSGLTPGLTTFTAKYAADWPTSGDPVQIGSRTIVVIAL